VLHLAQERERNGRATLHSQKEGLGGWQCPVSVDQLRRRDVGACDAQCEQLAGKEGNDESASPYTGESSSQTPTEGRDGGIDDRRAMRCGRGGRSAGARVLVNADRRIGYRRSVLLIVADR
jgi:hypothetical protein